MRLLLIIGLGVIVFLSAKMLSTSDPIEKEKAILHTLKKTLDHMHFSPQDIDDSFAEKVFDDYLSMFDGAKRFLTMEDIDSLSQFKYNIDDEILLSDVTFFDYSYDVLESSIQEAELYYKNILSIPFDFSSNDSIEMDFDKRSFSKNDTELKKYWKKYLKYEVLTRLQDKIEDNETNEEKKSLEILEKETREKVESIYDDWFKRLSKLRRSDRFELYLNAITSNYDPHSGYYSPKEKEDFNIRMQGKLEGIGARLQTDKDYTKVVSIIPGGPAWKGKKLEVNDLITAVAQKGEEFKDITGMRIDDVVQLIRGKKGTIVILKVKKKDGSSEQIEIERDEVIIEEGRAKSVVLSLENDTKNVGLIRLPSFYADFTSRNARSCADDVSAEIQKLKSQNVEGIILDLRFNGGGSLKDVVEIGGYFIEEGPIVQVKPRGRKPYVLKDNDKGDVKYDGPLVILVNSFSASASEILAAAMQDFERAIVVGGKSTFGKGTVQRFFDLDNALNGYNEIKPLGEIKITTQKFYRVTGSSTQLRGVTPDVILPDYYSFIDTGEKEYETALEWSEIEGKEYSQWIHGLKGYDEIVQSSIMRVEENQYFTKILENASKIKEYRDESTIPMNLKAYTQMINDRDDEDEILDSIRNTKIAGLSIKNLAVDLDFIEEDSSRIARNEEWIKNLEKDHQIEESMHIISDIIRFEDQ